MGDFISVQFEVVHIRVSSEGLVWNGHYVIVTQIHTDQFGQKPEKKEYVQILGNYFTFLVGSKSMWNCEILR